MPDPFTASGIPPMTSGRAPLKKFKLWPNNPRIHPDAEIELLAKVIALRGPDQPIVVDEDFVILKGHGRLKAAQLAGLKDFPFVQRFGLSESEKLAIRIEDNSIPLLATWDSKLLSTQLTQLKTDGYEMGLLGFSDVQIVSFLANVPTGDDPDATPEPPIDPVSRLGDLWHLGKHRLLCGDSTEAKNIARLMGKQLADLIFTSPPYAQQRIYKSGEVNDWDTLMRGVFSILPVKSEAQVLVNLGLVHRDNEWMPYWDGWIAWMREVGWRRFGWYIWDQGPGLPGDWNGRLAPSHEFIFHFNSSAMKANKSVESKMAGVISNGGLRNADGSIGGRHRGPSEIQAYKIHDSVFRVMRHKGDLGDVGSHPAIFPVALVEEIAGAYSKAGDIVFEPFCGSGTSIIACENSGRISRAIELAPAYVDVAVRRWQEFAKREATLAEDGRTFEQVKQARKKGRRRGSEAAGLVKSTRP